MPYDLLIMFLLCKQPAVAKQLAVLFCYLLPENLAEHFAQNEARNKAMEQENVALKAQLAEMNSRMEALTARLDTLSSAAK